MKDLVILIPCRNEKKTITKIVTFLKIYKIIIINDASSDSLENDLKFSKNIKILNNKFRMGYEKSLIKGIKYIKNLRDKKIKYILTMDADGEHNPIYVKKIYQKIKKQKFDLIIGNRSKKNRVSEDIISNILYKNYKIKDPLSGFKIYNVKYLFKFINSSSKKHFLSDICIRFIKENLLVKNINISTKINKSRNPKVNKKTVNKKILSVSKLI